jgi:hypothetical protein
VPAENFVPKIAHGLEPVEHQRCTAIWIVMSDAPDYLMEHARRTLREARKLPRGSKKFWLRHIGSIYHLLAKQGAYSNISFLDDYRAVRKVEIDLRHLSN